MLVIFLQNLLKFIADTFTAAMYFDPFIVFWQHTLGLLFDVAVTLKVSTIPGHGGRGNSNWELVRRSSNPDLLPDLVHPHIQDDILKDKLDRNELFYELAK